jgi:hypothetical protein
LCFEIKRNLFKKDVYQNYPRQILFAEMRFLEAPSKNAQQQRDHLHTDSSRWRKTCGWSVYVARDLINLGPFFEAISFTKMDNTEERSRRSAALKARNKIQAFSSDVLDVKVEPLSESESASIGESSTEEEWSSEEEEQESEEESGPGSEDDESVLESDEEPER